MSDFYALTVTAVQQLTPNAIAISFAIPEDLKTVFSFKAGQYITLRKEIDGEEVRRAYSISCAPSSGNLTVGIKKVENGTFSVWANTDLKVGDTLDVMPAEGRFVFEPDSSSSTTVCAFASGSGITPIMSIAKTVLESNHTNRFILVYGNKTIEETMYYKDIEALKQEYSDRFFIQWLFSKASVDGALFGRIENSTVNLVLKNQFKDLRFDAFYLCGPEQMIDTVSTSLKANDYTDNQIHFELFTASNVEDTVVENLDGTTKVSILLDDEEFELTMDQKEIVLDAILKNKIDAPYSCQGGVCSSCIARIKEGKAEMVKNQILTDGEIADGFILTCQAHPTTSTLKVDFDDV
ncbi:flavodoxin reductase [Croceivirga lutea]|uniref:ferredoxin--NADP reductase n=1 Tax=Croceivirga lutea TaxID=1775167 RepID=UPI00163AE074|nr:ferredoxin--NADP reductase [Croceivirga lutea]GGG39114.1 flavodoxin reductase [Croceivirga lutea]